MKTFARLTNGVVEDFFQADDIDQLAKLGIEENEIHKLIDVSDIPGVKVADRYENGAFIPYVEE